MLMQMLFCGVLLLQTAGARRLRAHQRPTLVAGDSSEGSRWLKPKSASSQGSEKKVGTSDEISSLTKNSQAALGQIADNFQPVPMRMSNGCIGDDDDDDDDDSDDDGGGYFFFTELLSCQHSILHCLDALVQVIWTFGRNVSDLKQP
jgi:hypothetical protein